MLNFRSTNILVRLSFIIYLLLILPACSGIQNEQQLLQSAKQYIEKGDLRAASIELKNTLKKNNNNSEARFLLGKLSMKAGHYKSALEAFNSAEKDGWDIEQIQLNRAKIFLDQRKFQKLINSVPDDINWSNETRANILGMHAIAHALLEHKTQAKDTIEQAVILKPDAVEVLRATAMLQLSGLLDGNTEKTIHNALSLYPNNSELLFLRAEIETKAENLLQASKTYKRIINLNPSNFVTPFGKRATLSLAQIQYSQQEYDNAKTTLAKLLANNDKDSVANYLSGLINYNQKNFLQAENHLHKVLIETPNHSRSLQLMGHIKFANEEYELASQHFEKHLKITPDDRAIQKVLAQTYIFLNQSDKAQSLIGKLLSYDAKDVTTLRLQSQILFSAGDIEPAITSLLTAVNQEPENILLREQLIKAYISSGKTSKALNEITALKPLTNNTKITQRLTVSAYVQAGKIDKAIYIANSMLEADPNDFETLSLIATLHASNNDAINARKYFNQSLKIKNNLSAAIGLANLNRKEGRINEAQSIYKKLIDSNIGGTLPMLALSELATLNKDENKMLSWLEKARTASSTEIKARLVLANYYMKNNNAEQADIYIQEALRIAPEKPETLLLHSKILVSLKRYNEAVSSLKKLVQKIPDSATAHVLLGKTFLQQNMNIKARNHLLTALELDKNHIQARILLTQTELREGQHLKALSHAKYLQAVKPDSSIGYVLEGDVWILKKNFHRAHTSYSRAWKLQKTPQLATKLFSVIRTISSFDDAVKPLTTWLSDNPDDISLHLYLAIAYQSVKRNDDAIEKYETALSLDPGNETALNNLAWLYSLSDNPKALILAEKAYRAAPNNAGIQDTYGWILVKNKQAKKGIKLIKKALDREPEILEIQYHYAAALVKSGDKVQGKKFLAQLLEQNKEFDSREQAQQLFNKL